MPIIDRRGGAVIGSIGARHLALITVAVPGLVRGHCIRKVRSTPEQVQFGKECKVRSLIMNIRGVSYLSEPALTGRSRGPNSATDTHLYTTADCSIRLGSSWCPDL